jgi:hypothetical protein
MHRRTVLRLTVGAGAALLVGCSDDSPPAASPPTATPGTATSGPVSRVAPDAEEVLSIVSGSFEQLVGARPFAFGIVGQDNQPVTGADVQVWVVPVGDGEATGPFDASFHGMPDQPLGLYTADVEIPVPGPTAFVAVTADGRAGADTIQVATPETSQLPAPGQDAVSTATPTTGETLGFDRVCTLDPPCGMHEMSLDDALADGRPVVVTFATPAYCHTAVCGPSVEVLEQVRTSGDHGDTVFVHCEIYADAGQTVGEPVKDWGLPSEPWLFTIDREGVIVNRTDGPLLTLPDHVTTMVKALG